MSTATLRAGQTVRLQATPEDAMHMTHGTVLEVFDDPKAPIAYVEFAGEARRWIFTRDLEAVHLPDDLSNEDGELRPPA